MKIYPAIDLMSGQIVRLSQGAFESKTIYREDPVAQAVAFRTAGARYLHVVDLDGARAGRPAQTELIAAIAQTAGLRVQVGGGVRSAADVAKLLAVGVDRVVIGSLAVREPDVFTAVLERFGPERVTLAIDVQLAGDEAFVATAGWTELSGERAEDLLARFMPHGLEQVLCTDIACDGMLAGPSLELYRRLASRFPELTILASGGIHALDDIARLKEVGARGAIIGKALYEGRLDLGEVLSC